MKLSVIIPVYNELKTIEECIKRVKQAPIQVDQLEIIISDNLSTDGTREFLKNIDDKNIKINFCFFYI